MNAAAHTAIALAALICGGAALAQNTPTPSTSATPTTSPTKAMTTKEKIQQLKPATNMVELMQLLNTIHNQVLLIDPYFMEDDNLLRLFGPARIERRKDPNGVLDSKRLTPSESNPLRFPILMMGSPNPPGYGSLTIGDFKTPLPFGHELIESTLMPGVQGSDLLHPLRPMTNEAREQSIRRGLATHPKGFWVYDADNTTASYDANLIARLDRNAQPVHIKLLQKETQK